MISNRGTRAIWSRLRHSRLCSGEAKAAPPPDPHLRVLQNFMMNMDKEKCRKKGLNASEVKPREGFSVMPAKAVVDMVRKKFHIDSDRLYEPTDSDTDEEDFEEKQGILKEAETLDKKLSRHQELLGKFSKSDTVDEAHSWMRRLDKFEEMHFNLRSEYRVIGELVNRLRVAQGKDKFLLQMKLNRALQIVQWKQNFDPNDPANYTILNKEQGGYAAEENAVQEHEKPMLVDEEDDVMEFNDMLEKDNILYEKLTAIDKQLEERLAALDHTFGRKGKRLEEEIRDLAEERNSLTQQKRQPLCRKVSPSSPSYFSLPFHFQSIYPRIYYLHTL